MSNLQIDMKNIILFLTLFLGVTPMVMGADLIWYEADRNDVNYKYFIRECYTEFKKHYPNNELSIVRNTDNTKVLVKCAADNTYQWQNTSPISRSYDKSTHNNARLELKKSEWQLSNGVGANLGYNTEKDKEDPGKWR